MKYILPIFALFLFILTGCEEEVTDKDNDNKDTKDSILVEVPSNELDFPVKSPSFNAELVGTWHLTEMWIDGNLMAGEELGDTFIEFTEDSRVTVVATGLDPVSSNFSYEDPLILAEALEGEREVLEVSSEKLVLLESVSGTEVRYVYERK